MKRFRRHASYANVTATLALVLALGGASAFAATQLANNSVGTKQLKKNSVTGAKVKNGSLRAADIKGAVASATTAASAAHAGSADAAANAAALGGQPPFAFLPSANLRPINWNSEGCGGAGCTQTLFSANGFAVAGKCDNEHLLLTPTELPPGEPAVAASGTELQFGKSLHAVFNTKVGAPILILDEVELLSEHLALFVSGRSAALDLTVAWTPGNCLVAGTASSS